jgi:hypothetical protein
LNSFTSNLLAINRCSQRPEGLEGQVLGLVRFARNIQSVMPLDVEGKLVCHLLVRQIVHLLENQTPQCGVQLFGWTTASFGKIGGNLMDGQLPEDVFLENAGRRLGQKLLPYRSQIVPRIER